MPDNHMQDRGLPGSAQIDMVASDAHLTVFNKLVSDLLKGTLTRNTFRPWEIEILLDIEGCNLREGSKRETLRRYQKAVQRQMEKGAAYPMKLSEYLENPRRGQRTAGETIEVAEPETVGV